MALDPSVLHAVRLILFTALVTVVAGLALILMLASRHVASYVHPPRYPVRATPADFGLVYENVSLLSEDSVRLAAWYVPPRNGATIIVLHGLATNRGDVLGIASDLAGRGYGLLLLDLRAHGDSAGDLCTLGLFEVRDVRAATRFLVERAPSDRVGVLGYSLGAATAIMAAAEIPELEAVIADSAFSSVNWLVENQFERLVPLPSWVASLVVRMGIRETGVDPREIAPVDRVARIAPRPLLLIHGEEDEAFLVENARLLYTAAREPKELWALPGTGHVGAYYANPAAYIDKVDRFYLDAFARVGVTGEPPRRR